MKFYESIAAELMEVEKEIEKMLENEPKEIYGMLFPFIKRGGKRIRPALAISCYYAVGGKGKEIIFPAALIEMFHNFTLIHDDIEDDSQFRRGEPTLHRLYGISIALNSGDALYTIIWNKLAYAPLDCRKFRTIERMFSSTFKHVVEGQGLELDWESSGRFDITEDEYFEMIKKKTAVLIGLSCEIGAMLGGANKKTCTALRKFGENIGIAFQIQDDVLNVAGDFSKYQKEIGGDITEGKRTLIVVHSLAHATPDEKKRLITILSSHTSQAEDIKYAIDLFRKYGSIDYAQQHAYRFVEEAKKNLECITDEKGKEILTSIADFVVKRER